MGMILANTSWLAVIVSLVLCMGLGFAWYNPKSPTGQIWMKGAGVTEDSPPVDMGLAMGMNTLGLFLAAIFVGGVGFSASILAILAYGALNTAGGLFAGKSVNVGLMHTGYWLVGAIIITLVHAILG
ncbi:Protein of unknown function [Octadecabacter temperatus]|jgi:hypothetical protein|uniref:Uncharacterized protein n=1 Tax=Octadecabacter temperatus TaxID=1458307 RepID=A0A0K0Y7R7_9RHOB|nr:DUF1761 domain-containing protein [Octadecabacter temperatus]AKS46907.1 hypothetical protein OSB_23710 [Octadecabacter temperatus]SIO23466.1 Protein of unknown function [Octadecabacter temperatus]